MDSNKNLSQERQPTTGAGTGSTLQTPGSVQGQPTRYDGPGGGQTAGLSSGQLNSPSQPSTSTTQSRAGETVATAATRAREEAAAIKERTSEVVDRTKQAVSAAYDKTAETLSETYNRTMKYGRENPGTLTLVAFGAGLGVGLLVGSGIAAGINGRGRAKRIAEPIVGALSQVALEFLR